MSKFRIHFFSNMYAFELYDSEGREIFDLETAIQEAEEQFPDEQWEVYNGEEGYSNAQ